MTRLLILGAVRIFQPAHGYLIRRELVSWEADQWAHLNPGSVYNALRSLAGEGLLAEQTPQHGAAIGRTARTAYRLTEPGEEEFFRLVRDGLWRVHSWEPERLLASLAFAWALTRAEVLEALAARRHQVQSALLAADRAVETFGRLPGKPTLVAEQFAFHRLQLEGELAWADAFAERLRAGAHGFAGEDPARLLPRFVPGGGGPAGWLTADEAGQRIAGPGPELPPDPDAEAAGGRAG